MSESVADDLLRNGFERWQRLEGEKQAISEDLKELFAELKGQGFDGKALRAAFRTVAKIDDADVQEHNAVVDLYVESLTAPRSGTVHATHTRAARETNSQPQPTKAAGQAETARASAPSSVENEAAEISTPITEQQASPKPASDLTSSQAHQGEVAPIKPETANEMHQSASHNDEPSSEAGPQAEASPAGTGTETLAGREARHEGETASAALPTPSRADRIKALRPHCQRPEACGSAGGKKHCHSCATAAQSQEEIA